jgi:hypothetical protein
MRALPFIVAILLFAELQELQAQQAVLSSSSNASGAGGTVSYSVGQTAFHTFTGAGAIVTEGVQQPYEILFMEGVLPGESVKLECVVFPNPVQSILKLTINDRDYDHMEYRLYSAGGKLLKTDRIRGKETSIPMEELAPDFYLLSVLNYGFALRNYCIIKNQGK